MEKMVLLRNSLLGCQVCADKTATADEVLEWVRVHNAAGTQNNWQHSGLEVVRCADDENRQHHVFYC